MTDMLSSHRVAHSRLTDDLNYGPHLFDLNKVGPAISIPDQMQRGYHAVLEGLERGYIGSDKPLLVIGAGVAGLMAAMTAGEEGVETWVIEKKWALSTLASCPTRFVCPTQYDWPASHWRKGFFPHDGEPMPFSWVRGNTALSVRFAMVGFTNKVLAHRGSLNLVTSEFLDYALVDVAGHWWVVPKLNCDCENLPIAFAMVLACAGFGKENTTVEPFPKLPGSTGDSAIIRSVTAQHPYTGFRFGEMDDYEADDPLLGIKSGIPKVVISGSGDGALQDFLRIVVRSGSLGKEYVSAGSLYEAIESLLRGGTCRKLETSILTVQNKFQSAIKAGLVKSDLARKQAICDAHTEAHAGYRQAIRQLIANTHAWEQVTKKLDSIVKNLQTEITIRVIYPCLHLTPFYGLNRFLVMLIREYAREKYPGVEVFHPNTMVSNVVSSGVASDAHLCGKPEHCHDKDHEIFCTPARCIDIPPGYITQEHKFADGPYNVVIVRHGIVPASRQDLLGGH